MSARGTNHGVGPAQAAGNESWVFGYGSLVWRPSFPYAERRPGFIRGWSRRFWQGSTDHRGVPGRPGRVVTLVESPGLICWGMAYRLAPERRRAILERLDHREQGGYERREVPIELAAVRSTASAVRWPRAAPEQRRLGATVGSAELPAASVPGVVYLATPENPNYLGPAPLEEIARQVVGSIGPSGENAEYVVELAQALRALGAVDAHVFELERLVSHARRRAR